MGRWSSLRGGSGLFHALSVSAVLATFAFGQEVGLCGPVCREVRIGDDRTAQRGYGGVLILPNGVIVAGYAEEYNRGWEYEAYIQRIASEGELIGQRRILHPDRPHSWSWGANGALLARGSSGGFTAVWQTEGGRAGGLFLQRFDSAEELIGQRKTLVEDFCSDVDVPAEGVPCGIMGLEAFRFYVIDDERFAIVFRAACYLAPDADGTRRSLWNDGIWIRMYHFDRSEAYIPHFRGRVPGNFRPA